MKNLVWLQVQRILEKGDYLDSFQLDMKLGHSTEMALIMLLDNYYSSWYPPGYSTRIGSGEVLPSASRKVQSPTDN